MSDHVKGQAVAIEGEPRAHVRLGHRFALYSPLALLVPAGVSLLGLARRSRRLRRRDARIAAGIGGAVLLTLARWQLTRWFTEAPRYEIEQRVGRVEIRRYEPRVVAATNVPGANFHDALAEGFQRLAGYIFGGNTAASSIAMTVPVASSRSDGVTTVTFGMPRRHPIASLPRPRDPRIELRVEPARRLAVLRYRGRYSGANAERKAAELTAILRTAGLRPVGEVSFAGYDPPSTLPFLRRLEAWVEVE